MEEQERQQRGDMERRRQRAEGDRRSPLGSLGEEMEKRRGGLEDILKRYLFALPQGSKDDDCSISNFNPSS